MKKINFAFLPLLLIGFVLPDDSCRQVTSNKTDNTGQVDGPYVSYEGDRVFVKYIVDDQGTKSVKKESMSLSDKKNISLTVLTDEPGKTFTVQLKRDLKNEEPEYSKVHKQFIVSDIEGNFRAFRRLLQSNNVIDTNFNWTFGNGHLVLTGDFVDRGDQQTEVLWLIYSLEEKAKAEGGHVHYVLGNHEIMNMGGDLRYLNQKYIQHASLLNEHFVTLYGENAELGRWLRTKNVIERVGDVLFCHGGISAAVNSMDISTSKINRLVRPYYGDSTYKYKHQETEILHSDLGPFWYRGYYTGDNRASIMQVDSTLSVYKVKHIATGHTIVADTVSILFSGKLFNTDVHHVKGHTEGLLIEDNNFYRVTSVGEKFLMLSR